MRPAKTQISLGICLVWSVFVVGMKKAWVLSYPLSAQRRLWSDWTDTQADLSLRWAHSHFVGFVMKRLILVVNVNCEINTATGSITQVLFVLLNHQCMASHEWKESWQTVKTQTPQEASDQGILCINPLVPGVSWKRDLGKQCRTRSDTAECGVW